MMKCRVCIVADIKNIYIYISSVFIILQNAPKMTIWISDIQLVIIVIITKIIVQEYKLAEIRNKLRHYLKYQNL